MLRSEDQELIQAILELFAEASGIPIEFYEVDENGAIAETIQSNKDHFPRHCHAVWALQNGSGYKACRADMHRRAQNRLHTNGSSVELCHAGLSNIPDPILVAGKTVAIIQYGAFLTDGESSEELSVRLRRHERALERLATDKERAEIKQLLLNDTPRYTTEKMQWLRGILPPILARIFSNYLAQRERERETQVGAYHDLQLRLTAALWNAELLQKRLPMNAPGLSSQVDDVVGAIKAAGTVMHSLTRGEYLPKEYIFKRLSLSKLIDEAIVLCQAEARARKIDIKRDFQPHDKNVVVLASSQHLQQAFNNVFQNAVKYSYHTSPTSNLRFISIYGRAVPDGYQIIVSNYGVGIEPDEYENIFRDGYKGRLTGPEYRGGAGQGLALTKRIIEGHGGTITPWSGPVGEASSEGIRPYLTKFTIWLPVDPSVDPQSSSAGPPPGLQ